VPNDTNILVRLLVADDPKQTSKVRKLFARLDKAAERAHVSDIVLCEVVWVLEPCYQHSWQEIAQALSRPRAARQLRFDSTDRLLRVLRRYESGKGDFADYMIQARASTGRRPVIRWSRTLARLSSHQTIVALACSSV
jgi:predicted nucleic-acid-binding protein